MARRPRGDRASRSILAFVGRFAGAWVITLIALALVPGVERRAVLATTASISLVSHLLRIECVTTGSLVRLAGADLDIVADCTSLMPTLALWAAMVAFPAALPWRAGGMVSGAALLWLYNLARVLALAFVLQAKPAWFDFVHAYLWQTLTLAVVFFLFVLWIRLQRADQTAQ